MTDNLIKYMNVLPIDILYIISGYYGHKISKELSDDIKDYKLLLSIKRTEYYNPISKTWHLENILNKLNSNINFNQYIWLELFRKINITWYSYSSDERRDIFKKKFCGSNESTYYVNGTYYTHYKF